jgi:hypothetical protein
MFESISVNLFTTVGCIAFLLLLSGIVLFYKTDNPKFLIPVCCAVILMIPAFYFTNLGVQSEMELQCKELMGADATYVVDSGDRYCVNNLEAIKIVNIAGKIYSLHMGVK